MRRVVEQLQRLGVDGDRLHDDEHRRRDGDPRRDGGAVPGGWVERSERPHRERRRPQRHHEELRRRLGRGGGHPDDGPDDAARRGRGGKPLAGAAVYLWHCTIAGAYSLYDDAVADENYLRGVQESDDDGKLTFTTIFPAAYSGRWPHMHFEVYGSLDAATSAGSKLKTSQIALPKETCDLVYATAGYEQSVTNLAQTSLESDNVFGDGYASQLATASGSVGDGFTLSINVGV
jgi:hypothetical protein